MAENPLPQHRAHLGRRTVVRTAAWSVPAISLASAAPAFAASGEAALSVTGSYNAANLVPPQDGSRRNEFHATYNNLRTAWSAPAWTGINFSHTLAYQAFALTVTNHGIPAIGRPRSNAATGVQVAVSVPMDLVFTTGAEAENVTLRSAGWTYLGGTTSTRSDRRTIWTFSFLSADDIVGGTSKSLDFYLSYTGDTYIPGGLRLPEIGADGYSKVTGADAVTGTPLMQDNLLTRTSA